MYTYTWWQWLLFFYFYCFAGWIWESCYVSFKEKRFVNRGFLHLPLLPLYGSGAVVVLFVALPFKSHPGLLFMAGMAAATCLELVTGLAMEAIYKVKYWDYSSKKVNFKGVICLEASLLWGVFSIIMVKLAHLPVEHLLLQIPENILFPVLVIISAAFCCDFYESNRDAIRLARILTAMEKAKEEMQANLRKMEEEFAEQKRILEEALVQAREKAEDKVVESILAAMERTEEMHQRSLVVRRKMTDSAGLMMVGSRRIVEDASLEMMVKLDDLREKTENASLEMMVKLDEIREKTEDASMELKEQLDGIREKTGDVKDSAGQVVESGKRKVEHAVESARLNILFGNDEFLRRVSAQKEEYLAQQNQWLNKAERLSRSMMLRNPTARTTISRDVNIMLRTRALKWLENKRESCRDEKEE